MAISLAYWPLIPLLLSSFASQAASEATRRGARLVWARGGEADTCVGIIGLTEDVKERLGYDPFSLPPEIEIEGTIQRTAHGYRSDLTFRDPKGKLVGKRELKSGGEDCRALGEAVAVAITVAIDPDSTATKEAVVLEPSDEPDEPPPPPPAPDEPSARGRVSFGAGVLFGLLPGASPMVRLRASHLFLNEHVEVGVGATWSPEARKGAYGFDLTTGDVHGCLLPWGARKLARICGALLVGAFGAFAYGPSVRPVDVGLHPWLGAELGPVVTIPLGSRVLLELSTSVIVPILRRQGFVRGATDPVWEQTPLAGRGDLSLGMLF